MDEESRLALLRDIWSTIRRANKSQPPIGRITQDLVLFTRAERSILRAGKGTVLQKMTDDLYWQELDEMYDAFIAGTH